MKSFKNSGESFQDVSMILAYITIVSLTLTDESSAISLLPA